MSDNNRIPFNKIDPLAGMQKAKNKQEQFVQEVGRVCNMLFAIMPAGMTVTYTVPESKIAILGKNINGGKIIITKPAIDVNIVEKGA